MRTFLRFTSAFVLALCAALAVHAEIYQWTDSNGKVHFSDSKPAVQAAATVTLDNINTFTDVSISEAPGWQGFYQPERKPGMKNVVMYSTERCGYCKKARRYFQQRGIAFTERNIEQDREAWEEYQQLSASGVPVILIGRQRMDGFNEATFDRLFYGEASNR
jgi:glutaredoxin